jgi:hypothetical protein
MKSWERFLEGKGLEKGEEKREGGRSGSEPIMALSLGNKREWGSGVMFHGYGQTDQPLCLRLSRDL